MHAKPGRELDALIAEKVMGWRLSDRGFYVKDIGQPESYDTPDTFKPSTDIAAAWQVVERMRLTHWVELLIYADVVYVRTGRWNDKRSVKIQRIEAPTAPHAICLAALKALGVEVPE